ncbi:MAG: hypothetical protein RJB66_1215 [Pseudomonadota bacterium]|jgi:hypothetical protein
MRLRIFILIGLLSYGPGAWTAHCLFAFSMKGHKAGSLSLNDEIRLCHANKKDVLLEIDYATQLTRSLVLSETTYYQFVTGFKNTFSSLSSAPSKNKTCRHRLHVKIDWEGIQKELYSCEGDSNFTILTKMNELVRDLYYLPDQMR